jgi:hypothetical protein
MEFARGFYERRLLGPSLGYTVFAALSRSDRPVCQQHTNLPQLAPE